MSDVREVVICSDSQEALKALVYPFLCIGVERHLTYEGKRKCKSGMDSMPLCSGREQNSRLVRKGEFSDCEGRPPRIRG